MVIAVWSVKGGVGASSFAALLALSEAQHARQTLLVDVCGDLPALLAVEDRVDGAGVLDWCSLDEPTSTGLTRLEVDVGPDLALLPAGEAQHGVNASALLEVLGSSSRTVIVDCGLVDDAASLPGRIVAGAAMSLLVVRRCYLNLRAAQRTTLPATGVVMMTEAGRSLGRTDIEAVTKVPVVADIAIDPTVARALDAGLLRARVPRSLLRSLGRLVDDAR